MLMKTDDRETGLARLEELAELLDRVHAGDGGARYEQQSYTHPCDSPMCALGHWAHANQDRWVFAKFKSADERWTTSMPVLRSREAELATTSIAWDLGACPEFSITRHEATDLFGAAGCGQALTAAEAARYVREFVNAKRAVAA